MEFIVIGVHKGPENIVGFRIMNIENGEVSNVSYQKLYSAMTTNKANIINMEIKDGQIAGSNGDISRYPVMVNSELVGKSPLIVLMEMSGDKYKVSNYMGEVVDMDNEMAVRYSESEGIANGKVVTRANGVRFISSIKGEYIKDEVLQDRGRADHVRNKSMILGIRDYAIGEDYSLIVKNKNLVEITIPSGVLILKEGTFSGCGMLERVDIPQTVEVIEAGAFEACGALKEIKIPEGIREIKKGTFKSCGKLKKVILPNSLSVIESGAFFNCRGLKVIECGPNGIENVVTVLPRGVRLVRRGR